MSTEKLIASWKSVDPVENRSRFYSLSLGEDLWGEEILVKRWGRLGGKKKENYLWPEDHNELLEEIKRTARRRSRHNYRIKKKGLFPSVEQTTQGEEDDKSRNQRLLL